MKLLRCIRRKTNNWNFRLWKCTQWEKEEIGQRKFDQSTKGNWEWKLGTLILGFDVYFENRLTEQHKKKKNSFISSLSRWRKATIWFDIFPRVVHACCIKKKKNTSNDRSVACVRKTCDVNSYDEGNMYAMQYIIINFVKHLNNIEDPMEW